MYIFYHCRYYKKVIPKQKSVMYFLLLVQKEELSFVYAMIDIEYKIDCYNEIEMV